MKECCERKTERTEQDKKAIISRISGQIEGVKKMISLNSYCDDVLIQLLAITKSVKSLANLIIEKHMYNCVLKNIKQGNLDVLSEVADMFKRFQWKKLLLELRAWRA